MNDFGPDGGWTASAPAWIALIPEDPSRRLLLDPLMLAEAGDVAGVRVLDLGCGEGRFSRMLAARGATTVGLDLTLPLLEAAGEARGTSESYVWGTGERLPFVDAAFDLVVSYLSLIDIPDYRAAIAESARVLRPAGRMVSCSIGNVVGASEGWLKDEAGRRLYHRVDRYLEERSMVLEWAGMRILNWHRPLSAYMDAYLNSGLSLRRYLEPMPADDSLRDDPRFEDWYRVPNFDLMVWEKT